MEKFYGFDLGDAESAVSLLTYGGANVPEILPVEEAKSFITAYARVPDGRVLIGESACYRTDVTERGLRFKSRFLEEESVDRAIDAFAKGVLKELKREQSFGDEDSCFYVGCPAGWDKNARERYRSIFHRAGYPPVKIVSESRAALVAACQSRHLQVGYDILSHPVLVVDVGSSTTDFAYIMGGKEVQLQTAGEVALGGGLMDEVVLNECIRKSKMGLSLLEVFQKAPAWRSYCEFAARRLKEKYFQDEDYWRKEGCIQTLQVRYDKPLLLTLKMDEAMARKVLEEPMEKLSGRSFRQVFVDSLKNVGAAIDGPAPELIFLTGGVSRLRSIAAWCREAFPDAVVISAGEPEFSVSRGLAWCGRIDEDLRLFFKEVEALRDSDAVEKIVQKRIGELYRSAIGVLTEPIVMKAVMPVIRRWKSGEIRRLCDINEELEQQISAWMHTQEAKDLLQGPVTAWLKPVSYDLEEYTVPICLRYNVPYKALSLTTYFSLSELDIKVNARDVFAVEEMTLLIDTIVSVVIGLLCGGSGIALIASGLPGIVAGVTLSLLVLLIGKGKMQEQLLKLDLPMALRRLVPEKTFENRLQRMQGEIRESIYRGLDQEKNGAITERLVTEISGQIESCLMHMARIVEVPLG